MLICSRESSSGVRFARSSVSCSHRYVGVVSLSCTAPELTIQHKQSAYHLQCTRKPHMRETRQKTRRCAKRRIPPRGMFTASRQRSRSRGAGGSHAQGYPDAKRATVHAGHVSGPQNTQKQRIRLSSLQGVAQIFLRGRRFEAATGSDVARPSQAPSGRTYAAMETATLRARKKRFRACAQGLASVAVAR